MSRRQRIIKNIAMFLGILLAIAIIFGGGWFIFCKLQELTEKQIAKADYHRTFTEQEAKEITKISLKNYDGSMELVTGERFEIQGYGVPATFGAKIEDGVLEVYYNEDASWFSGSFIFYKINDFEDAKAIITVPTDFLAGKVVATNGSGKLNIIGIQAEEFSASNGSGELMLKELSPERLSVSCGSGSVTSRSVTVKNGELTVGSGNMEFEGKAEEALSVTAGSGKVQLTMENERHKVNIKNHAVNGNVWIDGARAEEDELHDDADCDMDLTVGSGRIMLEFSK